MESFKQLGIGEDLLRSIKELNFENPSEIQEKTIPMILQGRDVIGKSATGSGKTLAFGAGIIEKVKKGKGIQALILTPTRELAEQDTQSLKKFAKNHDLKILDIYGGVSITRQIHEIRYSEIIVGTPGRILDHLERRTLNLSNISILVLDEADRMVDMGFLPDVEKIMKRCPQNKQTLLFSATISPDIDYMAHKYMKDPEYVSVKSYIESEKLKQHYYDVSPHEKFSLLVHLLKSDKSELVMVFCNTRRNADIVAQNLNRLGLKATAIHGGRTQSKRNNIMEQFHKGHIQILVCTDVAARGLDIKNVSHIYNYDIPKNSTDYIHRIGRTARAGNEGEAISLVTNRDYENFGKVNLDKSLKITSSELPNFEDIQFHFSNERKGFHGSDHQGRSGGGGRGFSDRRDFGGRNNRRQGSSRGNSRRRY